MPRYRRLQVPGGVFHVVSRFVNRDFLMRGCEERSEYLARAAGAFAKSDWIPVAYVLMSTHVHWALIAGEAPSESFVRPLHTAFAVWLNRHHDRIGPVFADRHATILCGEQHAAYVIAYVHNNPVRAGLVADASESGWSSHRAYLGLEPAPPWLDIERGLDICGFSSMSSGLLGFHEYVRGRAGVRRDDMLSELGLKRIRTQVREAVGRSAEISHPALTKAGPAVAIVTRPGAVFREPWCGGPDDVLHLVGLRRGISPSALQSSSRARGISSARGLALQAWRVLGGRQCVMAATLGIGEPSASKLVHGPARPDEVRAVVDIARRIRSADESEKERSEDRP